MNIRKRIRKLKNEKKYFRMVLLIVLRLIVLAIGLTIFLPIIIPCVLYSERCRKLTNEQAMDLSYSIVKKMSPIIHRLLGISRVHVNILSRSREDIDNPKSGTITLGVFGRPEGSIAMYQGDREVTLFYGSILKVSKKSRSIFIIRLIFILAHELRHAKQYQTNSDAFKNYISPGEDFVMYKKQDVETDADRFGVRFVFRSIIAIVRLIFKK